MRLIFDKQCPPQKACLHDNVMKSDSEGSPAAPSIPEHVLQEMIGRGSYGDVWRACTVTGALRAVKVVYRARFENSRTYEREYSGLLRVEPLSRAHESLVDILQVGRNDAAPDQGFFYYVMELADDAGDAASTTATARAYSPRTLVSELAGGRRLSSEKCARFGAEVAEGLAHLHSHGLVHRDIKPSNLIFVKGRLKLADIGLVAHFEDARTFVGTGGYIPPEGPGSPQADLFALGKVLYEMATGFDRMEYPHLPPEFCGLSIGSEGRNYAELNTIILRACATEVRERHSSASHLRGELLLVQAGQSVRKLRQHERMLAVWRRFALGASLAGLLGACLLVWQHQQTAAARQLALAETRQRQAVEKRELIAEQNLYAVDMNLAQVAINSGNYGRAEALLAAHVPSKGKADLRSFEWFHYWNRIKGDTIGVLRGHTDLVSGLAVSPDGTRLYSCSHDDSVREWSLIEKRQLRQWTLPGGRFMALAIDPAGERIAVEGGNPSLSAWLDIKNGSWTTNQGTTSRSVAWTPDGKKIIRGSRNYLFETTGVVEQVDLTYGSATELSQAGGCIALSSDGTRLLTGPWRDSIKLWSWPGLELLGSADGVGTAHALAFSPDGQWLAAGTREGRIILFDGHLKRRVTEQSAHGNGVIWSVAFSPDSKRLASVGNDQTLRTWSLPALTPEHVYRGHRSEVWSVHWSPDGRQLLSAGKDMTIRIWEAERAKAPERVTNLIQAPLFSGDEKFIALRHRAQQASIYDLKTLQLRYPLGVVGEMGGFSADNQNFMLLTIDSVFQERRIADGQVMFQHRLEIPVGSLTKRLLTPKGRWLISGLSSGELILQSTTNGSAPLSLKGHTDRISALAVSEDEKWLVSGSVDRTARLWDLETMSQKHLFTNHRMGIGDVSFAVHTDRVATGSWDDSVHLWNSGDLSELVRLDGHEGGVQAVAQTVDGRTVAALSGLGVLKFWNVAAQRETGHHQLAIGPQQGWITASPSGRWIAVVDAAGELSMLEAPAQADVK